LEAGYYKGLKIIFWTGIILSIISGWIGLTAILTNTYLESTARIQKDRNQIVCQSGPYAVIRHPVYTGIIISCIAVSMVFQNAGVMICAGVISIIIIIRTYLEDTMLKNGLEGYKE
jgi:protein-S-isoprenylcysteine O-methyltransferase Ste14